MVTPSMAAIRAGLNRFGESAYRDREGSPIVASVVASIGPRVRGLRRLLALGHPALREVLAVLNERERQRVRTTQKTT